MELREINVTPHIARNTSRRSAIDGRTTRHPGYAASLAHPQTDRGGLRLDEDHRRLAEDKVPGDRQSRMGLHPRRRSLQPDPAAEAVGGDMNEHSDTRIAALEPEAQDATHISPVSTTQIPAFFNSLLDRRTRIPPILRHNVAINAPNFLPRASCSHRYSHDRQSRRLSTSSISPGPAAFLSQACDLLVGHTDLPISRIGRNADDTASVYISPQALADFTRQIADRPNAPGDGLGPRLRCPLRWITWLHPSSYTFLRAAGVCRATSCGLSRASAIAPSEPMSSKLAFSRPRKVSIRTTSGFPQQLA